MSMPLANLAPSQLGSAGLRRAAADCLECAELFRPATTPADRWASGGDPGLVDAVAGSLFKTAPATLFRARPALCDAQPLIQEVMACAHRGYRVALLDLARLGLVRLFTTAQVVAEVDDRLADACGRSGADLGVASGYWVETKASLRVIEVPPSDLPDLATAALADRQIAALGRVFGSALTWSADGHLTDPGRARPYPLEVVLAVQELAAGEWGAYLGLNFSAAGVDAAVSGVRALVGAIERRPLLGMAMIMVAAFGAGYAVARRREVVVALRQPALGEAVHSGIRSLVRASEWRTQLLERIPVMPPPSASDPSWVNLARVLASAPLPLSAARMREVLALHGVSISERRAREELQARPLFVRTNAGRWQLGAW